MQIRVNADHIPRFNRAAVFALGAAALFGISTPFAKLLLVGLPPVLLAGLLYLGDRRIALGMGLIVGGGIALSWQPGQGILFPAGALAVGGACLGWAIDNNLTQKVSTADPLLVASIKGFAAGLVNTTLGLLLQPSFPRPGALLSAALVGFVGYGLSLALFVLALRHLGTARTAAHFSLAPFIGSGASIAVLSEPITTGLLLAGVLMAAGAWLHLSERHQHEHQHEGTEHSHRHVHDEHHRHTHAEATPPGEPHSHTHVHERVTHAHPHYPDIHDRHRHE